MILILGIGLRILIYKNPQQQDSHTTQSQTDQIYTYSPDKTKEIIIVYLPLANDTQPTQTVQVYLQEKNKNKKLLWQEDDGRAGGLYIPSGINPWSFDQRFVYIMLSEPDAIDPIIIKTDGTAFSSGKLYIHLGVLFNKQTGYLINNIIGWNNIGKFSFSAVTNDLRDVGTYTFDPTTESFNHEK